MDGSPPRGKKKIEVNPIILCPIRHTLFPLPFFTAFRMTTHTFIFIPIEKGNL